MFKRCFAICALPLLCGAPLAQIPTPNPIPRVAPRAAWTLSSGVTGTPTQRRDNPGAASDDRMYVFGGYSGNATSTTLNALYEFDGSSWTLRTAEGAPGSPATRGRSAIAWDFQRSKLVVFGGNIGGASQALLGDTWEWDPVTNAWTDVTPAASPSPRQWAALAWEPNTGGMLLFGGDTGISTTAPSSETWLLLAGTWINLGPTTTPPARRMHSLMTRADFTDVFMCGGQDATSSPATPMLDTWRWNGGDWVQVVPTTNVIPASVNANQAVYDATRKRVVMQGGQGLSTLDPIYVGYGGSPTTWCSEFDCVTNEWLLYGLPAFGTGDPVIGRISRYFGAYIPALGKVFKVSGQNPAGIGTTTLTCEYQATPVASAVSASAGCSGSAGPVVMAAVAPNNAPWTGRAYDYQVSGLATGSFVLAIIGFAPTSIPLSAIDPTGLPGCTLDVSLDLSYVLPNTGGTAAGSFVIPNVAALGGGVLYQQALQLELTGGTLSALSSSNALQVILGAL